MVLRDITMVDMPNLNQILITNSLPVRHADGATSSNPTHVKLIPIVIRNLLKLYYTLFQSV